MSSVCENLLAREIFQRDLGAIHPFGGEIVETHVDSGRAAECRRADEQARGGERGQEERHCRVDDADDDRSRSRGGAVEVCQFELAPRANFDPTTKEARAGR